MGGDAPYLPEEIIGEILKRLPVKPLIRFQCVCKQWKNLIKSPPFIADHLHHSAHQNSSLLLIQNGRSEPLRVLYIDYDMRVHRVQNTPLIGSSSNARIIGSSNGLVCLVIIEDISKSSFCLHDSLLLLWNPATTEIRQIPRSKTSVVPEWDCIGFGFSSVVNDYEIVKTYNDGQVTKGVEVYSLRTGSWKGIEFETLKGIVVKGDTITVNGSIFWDGLKPKKEEGEEDTYLIVSFDMATEVIAFIPRPWQSRSSISKLTSYEDKVAIFCLHRIGDPANCFHFSFDLLVLEEDTGLSASAERWSWTNKLTSNSHPFMYPWTIWRDEIVCDSLAKPTLTNEGGQEIVKDEEKFSLYFIKVINNECNRLWIPEYRFGQVINYIESLVPVDNIHFEEPL